MVLLLNIIGVFFLVLTARASYVYDQAFRRNKGFSYVAYRAETMRGIYAVLALSFFIAALSQMDSIVIYNP